MTLGLAIFQAAPAKTLSTRQAIAQYKHTRWTVDEGAPPPIISLAQGRDGFLWIGSVQGLFRFDGLKFEAIQDDSRTGSRNTVLALLAARNGDVYAGYTSGGVARYRGGVLRDTGMPDGNKAVRRLREGGDGSIWAQLGGGVGELRHFVHGHWERVGANRGLPSEEGVNLLVARDGTVWFTSLHAASFLKPGSRRFERSAFIPAGQARLAEDSAGNIWASDKSGARVISSAAKGHVYPVPYLPRSADIMFDRDGSLWGTLATAGIFRARLPLGNVKKSPADTALDVEQFQARDMLTSDNAVVIIEDREGSIWVGTEGGLDRFRETPIVNEPLLKKRPVWGALLLRSADGSVYIGQADGVYRVKPRGDPELVLSGVGEPEAMCEGADRIIWLVMRDRILRYSRKVTGSLPKPEIRQSIDECAVDQRGDLFLSAEEGLFHRHGAGWQLLTNWKSASDIRPLLARRNGAILTFLSGNTLRQYILPKFTDFRFHTADIFEAPNAITEARNSVLLGGRFGLARWQGQSVRVINERRVPAFGQSAGIVEMSNGTIWVLGRLGIAKVEAAALDRAFANPRAPVPVTLFDYRDGLQGTGSGRYSKHAAVQGIDGRIWFAAGAGTVWMDPAALRRNALPPPVVITSLRTGTSVFRDPTLVKLPAGTSSISIDFAALSLVIPARVRLRYRLEGVDEHWVDPGQLRRAAYTNLRPGAYRFRVVAANNDGVWNREGAALELTLPPTFRQSKTFLVLCALAVALLLWAAYKVRTRQLTRRVRERLEAKISERERIARELHDTLLQGFQGLMLRFQSVANRMGTDSNLREPLDQALERAEAVLTEGRQRVSELRFAYDGVDLPQALADIARALTANGSTKISVTAEGTPRALDPMVREELLRIAEEAIGNALRHAEPRTVDIALLYGSGEIQLGISDDGVGLPGAIAAAGGRAGHYGLVGMRERAERVGGRLNLASRLGGGTEVRVAIPARLAYSGKAAHRQTSSVTTEPDR